MLKNFFTVMLGSMAAIWLSIIIAGLVIVVGVFTRIGTGKEAKIPEHSFLYLDLSGEIKDRESSLGVADLLIEGATQTTPTFEELLFSLKEAKDDPRIDAVFMNLGSAEISQAMLEELMEALVDFKSSGKEIHAYSDSMTQGDFYLASVADKVTLNPAGYIDFRGMTVTVPFFKDALEKLGVEVQILKVGTYKSSVEPFTLTDMSEPNRLQYTELLDSLWKDYLTTISQNLNKRGVSYPVETLDSLATELTLFSASAQKLIDEKFITSSNYRRPGELALRQNGDDYDKFETRRVTPQKYIQTQKRLSNGVEGFGKRPHIALLYAIGDIVDWDGVGGIVGERYVEIINRMAEDENVKALVMRVNSGGGSAFASEQIWAALENFKHTGKPFYVSIGEAAASGGYYISSGADKIFADRASLTGSIGIFGIIPYAQELLNDKLGITFSTVSTNKNASFPSFDRPLTPDQHRALEDHVAKGYELFLERVAKGRGLSVTQVDSIGQGRVWTGAKAKDLGLVDEIGGLSATLSAVSRQVALDPKYDLVCYPQIQRGPLEAVIGSLSEYNLSLASSSSVQTLAKITDLAPKEIKAALSLLDRIKSMSAIQAKMEDIEIK